MKFTKPAIKWTELAQNALPAVSGISRTLFFRLFPLAALAIIVAMAFFMSLLRFQIADDYWTWCQVFFWVFAFFVFFLSPWFRRWLGRVDWRLALALIVILAAVVRIWLMLALPTQPIYDYQSYHDAARAVSQAHLSHLQLLEGRPWGFPVLLGLVYLVFGAKVIVAQGLNLVLSLAAVVLLYLAAERIVSRMYALLAAFFFALLPSQILMNNVINSEILFIVLALAGVYFSLRYMQEYALRDLILTGFFFGLAQNVRPVAIFYLAVFLGFLFLQLIPGHWKTVLKACVVTFLAFYVALIPFLALKSYEFRQVVLWEKGTFGMVFLMGTNPKSEGAWNREDYNWVHNLEVKYQNNGEIVNKLAFGRALERFSKLENVERLLPKKVRLMWGMDSFGWEWANVGTQGRKLISDPEIDRSYFALSQLYYCAILLVLLGLFAGFRLERQPGFRYLTALFLAFFVIHLLIEVQGRYHMHITPYFFVLLAIGLQSRDAAGESLINGPNGEARAH